MVNYAPGFKPGKDITWLLTTAVTAGQTLVITGDYSAGVGAAGATPIAGVALYDGAVGDRITLSTGGVQRPVVTGAVTAGQRVALAANGTVSQSATNTIGTVLAAAVDGAKADVRFDV